MDDCECSRRLSRRDWLCLGLCLLVLILLVGALVFVIPKLLSSSKPLEWNGTGTTPHFDEIFLGRCYIYTQLLRPGLGYPDCVQIMNTFRSAIISKNPCNITEEDYRPLMELDNQTVPCNKSLFWSKSNQLAHQYTQIQRDMFTLEDTLLGYMANELSWCGDPNTSEMNKHSCPHWRLNCPNNPVSVFWKVMSQKFAEAACGMVHVMLNGSHIPPFDKSSTFGSVEVVNLNPKKVHSLQAWMMYDFRISSSNACLDSSINDLKMIVEQNRIAFMCEKKCRLASLHSECKNF
ncbi:ADP-ribosyl cyclase/cyclic ADP-ribose hydrolase 1 [Thomomys bottae]